MSKCKFSSPMWRWDAHLCSACSNELPDDSTSALAAERARSATMEAEVQSLLRTTKTALDHSASLQAEVERLREAIKWTGAYLRMNRRSSGLAEVVKTADEKLEAALAQPAPTEPTSSVSDALINVARGRDDSGVNEDEDVRRTSEADALSQPAPTEVKT